MRDALLATYSTNAARATAINELALCKQRHSEKVSEFLERLRRLVKRLNLDENAFAQRMFDEFVSRVKDDIRYTLSLATPANLSEATAKALAIEAANEARELTKNSDLESLLNAVQTLAVNTGKRFDEFEKKVANNSNQQTRNATTNKGPCYYCGKPNHVSRECRKRIADMNRNQNFNQFPTQQQRMNYGMVPQQNWHSNSQQNANMVPVQQPNNRNWNSNRQQNNAQNNRSNGQQNNFRLSRNQLNNGNQNQQFNALQANGNADNERAQDEAREFIKRKRLRMLQNQGIDSTQAQMCGLFKTKASRVSYEYWHKPKTVKDNANKKISTLQEREMRAKLTLIATILVGYFVLISLARTAVAVHAQNFMICQARFGRTLYRMPETPKCSKFTFNKNATTIPKTYEIYKKNEIAFQTKATVCQKVEQTVSLYTNGFNAKFYVEHKPKLLEVSQKECENMIKNQECGEHGKMELKNGVWSTKNKFAYDYAWPIFGSFSWRNETINNCLTYTSTIFSYFGQKHVSTPAGKLNNCIYDSGFCQFQDNAAIK